MSGAVRRGAYSSPHTCGYSRRQRYRGASGATVEAMQQLSRPARRALLVLHIAVSVSWLGLTLGLLALDVTGYTTDSPDMAGVACRAMKLFGDWLVLPVALVSLVSGLVLSVGTAWGRGSRRREAQSAVARAGRARKSGITGAGVRQVL
ncbi:hypothetical protein SAMN05428945_1648 [Streptomyces sp. 2224.1]|nr:hypothetical protein BX261_3684 [Streptomyces sp. 2321.6]SDR39406.1 hypothetical protein SAMN05216511_3516 [Streptomyces sp. KS_16]SEB96090.1 hypothetical protein SAMN05428945_1648 [Streptomyces sp. 2224.1]SED06024.1 hypothetical protein SAMN05428940_3686 [Streptomyces sp. 2133.1]SNC69808.1 hypothetical protein SAMN06272741_3678 [Streptomyces sp. 2114.4]